MDGPDTPREQDERTAFPQHELPSHAHMVWKSRCSEEANQTKTWTAFLQAHPEALLWNKQNSSLDAPVYAELQRLVRTIGVPASLRPLLWQTFSGAKAMMELAPNDYSRLTASLTKEMRSSAVMAATADQVDKDLQRTFPTHDFFESKEGMETLRRVLLAYSLRNPAVGYCQSMNFIVAILILFMEEEAAYWVLVALLPSQSQMHARMHAHAP
jgi:hypothetical protein